MYFFQEEEEIVKRELGALKVNLSQPNCTMVGRSNLK